MENNLIYVFRDICRLREGIEYHHAMTSHQNFKKNIKTSCYASDREGFFGQNLELKYMEIYFKMVFGTKFCRLQLRMSYELNQS